MGLSQEAMIILSNAIAYAQKNNLEYVTPEIVLLIIAENETFAEAFEACGGDLSILADNITEYTEKYLDKEPDVNPELSSETKRLLNIAGQSAYNSGCTEVCVRHLVHAIWKLQNSYAVYYMERQGITGPELLLEFTWIESDMTAKEEYLSEDIEPAVPEDVQEKYGRCISFAPCLNDTLKDVNPLIGREKELDRTIQILCRKDKNNPLHIGEPGVGKTAITYGLVQMIRENRVPEALAGARIFSLDLGGMLAGTQYRGDFEKRLKKVLSDISCEEKPIIYIDEIHNISGAGAVGESSIDASNMLKPYLTDGHIRFIGATTYEEYKKYFEKNKSLVRRFQNIEIKEPSEDETIRILEGLKDKYEDFHGVKYSKGVIEYAVQMSSKYINERYLPDKAIDLIDEAGAYRKLHPTDKKVQIVDKKIINEVLTTICRVPVETVKTDDVSGLSNLEKRMKKKIFGQDEAVEHVVNAVKFSKAGLLDENKPLASLLFVGPTGVGKTEIAKTLAEELGIRLIRFDMSEYGEKHAVAKLIGAPAGYVGYEEGGLLTESIRKNPSSVLLLDEIEKAHSDIYNVLLQVMDYATLTDNQGRKADFRNVIVIMTSNAGASQIGKKMIGFGSENQNEGVIMEAVKQTFQPEFRNRLNKIVVFNSMDEDMASRIAERKLSELVSKLSARKIKLSVDKSSVQLIIKRGITPEFGAREVDRIIRNDIKPLFVDKILFGTLKKGGDIKLFAENDEFFVS